MFKQFDEDLTYLPRRKFNAKYTIPFLLILLSCVLIGQIISTFVPLNQLNRIQGNVINIETRIISWHHNRGSFHDTPDYALVITLDNGSNYNIQEETVREKLGATLKRGDNLVVYYPTETLRILTAGLARDVSQVERDNQILYSWKQQQTEEWVIAGVVVLLMVFLYWMKGYLRDFIETPKF